MEILQLVIAIIVQAFFVALYFLFYVLFLGVFVYLLFVIMDALLKTELAPSFKAWLHSFKTEKEEKTEKKDESWKEA